MKFIIFLILTPLILFSTIINAEENKLLLKLMNEPVDKLTFGLFKCDLLLEKDKELANLYYRSGSGNQKYKIGYTSCDYKEDINKIVLNYIVLDANTPAPEMTNKDCEEFIIASKKSLYIGGNKTSSVLYNFLSKSFFRGSPSIIDANVYNNLDDYISIHIGDGTGGHRCESNLKSTRILYTK